MPRTKTIKTTRTGKTYKTKKAQKTEPKALHLSKQTPVELVKDMAAKGLHLGLGLGAYLLDYDKNLNLSPFSGNFRHNLNTLVTKAIHKGEKIEREQVKWLTGFEQEQRKRIKAFLNARRLELKRTEASLEEKIGEVINNLDIPTRRDIQQLNHRLNDLSKQITRQKTKATPKRTKKVVESPTVGESA